MTGEEPEQDSILDLGEKFVISSYLQYQKTKGKNKKVWGTFLIELISTIGLIIINN